MSGVACGRLIAQTREDARLRMQVDREKLEWRLRQVIVRLW